MMAIERVGTSLSAQGGMVGPMTIIALGALLLGEPFTAWVALGPTLVIGGIDVFAKSGRS